jgi:hypothetical protein
MLSLLIYKLWICEFIRWFTEWECIRFSNFLIVRNYFRFFSWNVTMIWLSFFWLRSWIRYSSYCVWLIKLCIWFFICECTTTSLRLFDLKWFGWFGILSRLWIFINFTYFWILEFLFHEIRKWLLWRWCLLRWVLWRWWQLYSLGCLFNSIC